MEAPAKHEYRLAGAVFRKTASPGTVGVGHSFVGINPYARLGQREPTGMWAGEASGWHRFEVRPDVASTTSIEQASVQSFPLATALVKRSDSEDDAFVVYAEKLDSATVRWLQSLK